MDNPEQYLLQVFRRTQASLQDSLIPIHASKMHQLTEKLEQAPTLKDEIGRLRNVNGFTKAALSMQWILERVEKSGEDFSPDQFDIDAATLNDKLFEAFLSEPFDAPTDAAVAAPLEASTDSIPGPAGEAIAAEPEHVEPQAQPQSESQPEPLTGLQPQSEYQPESQPEPLTGLQLQPESQPESQPEPLTGLQLQPEPEPEPATPPPPPVEEAPALTDLLDQNLLLGFQRFTEIVAKLGEKTPAERKSVFAVLAMIAKSSTEVARAQGKKDVLDFFQSVIKFITYVDTSGSAQDSRVAEIMREVGERLSKALKERSNGPALLQSINQILQNPESSLNS
jgi:outer membrane biosynthesis protein TonB